MKFERQRRAFFLSGRSLVPFSTSRSTSHTAPTSVTQLSRCVILDCHGVFSSHFPSEVGMAFFTGLVYLSGHLLSYKWNSCSTQRRSRVAGYLFLVFIAICLGTVVPHPPSLADSSLIRGCILQHVACTIWQSSQRSIPHSRKRLLNSRSGCLAHRHTPSHTPSHAATPSQTLRRDC